MKTSEEGIAEGEGELDWAPKEGEEGEAIEKEENEGGKAVGKEGEATMAGDPPPSFFSDNIPDNRSRRDCARGGLVTTIF